MRFWGQFAWRFPGPSALCARRNVRPIRASGWRGARRGGAGIRRQRCGARAAGTVPCPSRSTSLTWSNGGAVRAVERQTDPGVGLARCSPWRRCRLAGCLDAGALMTEARPMKRNVYGVFPPMSGHRARCQSACNRNVERYFGANRAESQYHLQVSQPASSGNASNSSVSVIRELRSMACCKRWMNLGFHMS